MIYCFAEDILPVEIVLLVQWLLILAEGPLLGKCNDFLCAELFIMKPTAFLLP